MRTRGKRAGELSFYWEFGGGDSVAIVTVGDAAEWRERHPWATERRAEILRYVGDELILPGKVLLAKFVDVSDGHFPA